jgi:glycosyl transferase family 1
MKDPVATESAERRASVRSSEASGVPRSQECTVLLLSMRRLANLVAYCAQYEFEDLIAAVTSAERIEVSDERALEFSRRAYKLVRTLGRSRGLAARLAPWPSTVRLERDYELFFPVFNHTHELYALRTIPDWRARCRVAACYVAEVWAHLLPPRYLLELLGQFDHIFVGTRHCAEAVARICGRPCTYLPQAVDVLRFSPWPDRPVRTIDLCNIGRRSAVTHDALVKLAAERRIFYYFDTFAGGAGKDQKQRTFRVANAAQHRLLLASLLRRSRYFITHRSRINEPEHTDRHEEIAGRFYEGAAAGAVMIGEAPNTEEFRNQFGWQDAVVRVPFDCADIGQMLAELDRQPERLARIRDENARNAALRHDWLHRLEHVFKTLGITPTAAMRERQRRLDELAAAHHVSTVPSQ